MGVKLGLSHWERNIGSACSTKECWGRYLGLWGLWVVLRGEWRRLHNEELYDLYFSPNIIQVIKWRKRRAGNVARTREKTEVHQVLVLKPEGKRPLGRLRYRLEGNFKMDLNRSGVGGHGLDWSGSEQGQVAGLYECGNEVSGFIKRWEFHD